jgi:D-alanyl-D-alanine carboxypeptidase/D-alanyl-D-alanine-endopeptidase (penicillin-binding protein 4)
MIRTIHSLILLSVLLISEICAAQKISSVEHQISAWRNFPGLANAGICLNVIDNQNRGTLFHSDPQISLVPASIMKVVTTATALEVFGPDYRFKTTLAYSGIVRNDTLWGDLQIIGGGDPTLGSMYFPETRNFQDEWIKALQQKNIRVISGNLIMDASIYESQIIPGSWVWDDLGNYYGAGASGISIYDNSYEIHLKSPESADQPTQILKVAPEIPDIELRNEVLSSDINSDQAYITGNPEDSRRVIRGTIPKGKSDFIVKGSMPNPALLLSNEFRNKLRLNGITLQGSANFEKSNVNPNTIIETISPPLRDIIRVTNFESVNLFAEHFLKHLAWQKTGLGTTKDGCKFVLQFWKDKGLDMTGFFMSDGSGLSRFDALTAQHMTGILNYMKTKSQYAEDFYQSLASPGNGTLTVFNPENFPNNSLHAKSGSMTRVRCYAGYLITQSGKDLSFTIMLNNFSCTQAEVVKKIQELLVELRKI